MTHFRYLYAVSAKEDVCEATTEEQNEAKVSHTEFMLKQSHNYPEQTQTSRSSESPFAIFKVILFNTTFPGIPLSDMRRERCQALFSVGVG